MVKIQHFRSCHASVFIMSKRCIEQHTNDDESEPAIKKLHPDRSFTQLGLNKFFPGPATEVHLSPVRKYGIKVYSKSEICDASSDMEQKYRCFWNEKAEEICGSKATLSLLKTKQAIQGAIHSAWVIQKTEYLLLEVDHQRQIKWLKKRLAKRFVQSLRQSTATQKKRVRATQRFHRCTTACIPDRLMLSAYKWVKLCTRKWKR